MERQIGLLLDPGREPIGMRCKRRAPPAPVRLGFNAALAMENLHPFDRGRGSHIENLGLRPRRLPLFHIPDQPDTKIVRISHPCPRLEWEQNQLLRGLWESPSDSPNSGTALTLIKP